MTNAIYRKWLRIRLTCVLIETALAEAVEHVMPGHLEHLAQRETALRTKITATLPVRVAFYD